MLLRSCQHGKTAGAGEKSAGGRCTPGGDRKSRYPCGGRKTYVDQASTSAAGMDRGRCRRGRQKRLREKQERLEKSEEFRIKQLHFADNEGIMSEEIGSDESYDRKAVSESRWQV